MAAFRGQRYDEFRAQFPYRVDLPDTGGMLGSPWYQERSCWIAKNHPDTKWGRLSISVMVHTREKHYVRYGFTTQEAAVHFALRWKGE